MEEPNQNRRSPNDRGAGSTNEAYLEMQCTSLDKKRMEH